LREIKGMHDLFTALSRADGRKILFVNATLDEHCQTDPGAQEWSCAGLLFGTQAPGVVYLTPQAGSGLGRLARCLATGVYRRREAEFQVPLFISAVDCPEAGALGLPLLGPNEVPLPAFKLNTPLATSPHLLLAASLIGGGAPLGCIARGANVDFADRWLWKEPGEVLEVKPGDSLAHTLRAVWARHENLAAALCFVKLFNLIVLAMRVDARVNPLTDVRAALEAVWKESANREAAFSCLPELVEVFDQPQVFLKDRWHDLHQVAAQNIALKEHWGLKCKKLDPHTKQLAVLDLAVGWNQRFALPA
jgi:hypothetical protein